MGVLNRLKWRYVGIIYLLIVSNFIACGQVVRTQDSQGNNQTINIITENKMKVEIWSDIICPYCYIGKRKFEAALAQFPHKDHIQVEWKSFQLAPDIKTQPNKNAFLYMGEQRGKSVEQTQEMTSRVTQLAKQVGLTYNFDKTIAANTFNAHRFAHFARQYGKQNEAEELLFRSFFTDGKNIDDYQVLIQLGAEIGLDTIALKTALENNSYANNVYADIYEAQQIGVSGVPFFVFNRKLALSGAQESTTFLETLEKAYAEWRKENPETSLKVTEGQSCTLEGECK